MTLRSLSLTFALLATLVGCSRDPVDRELVGSWQTAIASPAGAWQLRFTTLSNGQYRTDFQGPAPLPPETGYFKASGGKWRLEKLAGSIDEGSYEFVSTDTVLFKSKTGTVLWNRIPNDLAAAAAPDIGAGGPTATVPGNAAQPSADLLAVGPFGSALAGPAALPTGGSATNAVPASTAFSGAPSAGLPAAPPNAFGAGSTPVPAGLPFNIPQQPTAGSGAFGSAQQQVQSNAQALTTLPRKTLTDIQGSARQGAANVANSAAAPVTEVANEADQASHKVGQRIESVTSTAAAKVRNFFTRGRRKSDEQNGNAAPQQGH